MFHLASLNILTPDVTPEVDSEESQEASDIGSPTLHDQLENYPKSTNVLLSLVGSLSEAHPSRIGSNANLEPAQSMSDFCRLWLQLSRPSLGTSWCDTDSLGTVPARPSCPGHCPDWIGRRRLPHLRLSLRAETPRQRSQKSVDKWMFGVSAVLAGVEVILFRMELDRSTQTMRHYAYIDCPGS